MASSRIEVTRGGTVESSHRLHAAVADPEGRLLYTTGDPDRVTYRVYEGQPRKVIVKAAMQDNIQGVVLCRRTPTTSLGG